MLILAGVGEAARQRLQFAASAAPGPGFCRERHGAAASHCRAARPVHDVLRVAAGGTLLGSARQSLGWLMDHGTPKGSRS